MKSIAIWVAFALALAGCAGEPEPVKTPGSDPDDPGTTPDDNTTGDPVDQVTAQLAPRILLGAQNGTAPLTVNISLEANTTGPVAWRLDVETAGNTSSIANGSVLPATVEHTFGPGMHNVTFTVDDNGTVAVTNATLVVAPGSTGPSDLVQALTYEGSFAEGASTREKHTFDVQPGLKAISVWVDWEGGTILSNSAYPNDIDGFLIDPAGTQVAAGETLSYEFLSVQGDLAAGTWTIDLLPYDIVADTSYTALVHLWYAEPTVETITGSFAGDFDLGEGIAVADHTLAVPAEAQAVQAYLTWTTAASETPCNSSNTRSNDLDLEILHGGSSQGTSGYFHSCEFVVKESGTSGSPLDMGGDWTFRVVPFYSVATAYTVTVWIA